MGTAILDISRVTSAISDGFRMAPTFFSFLEL